MRSWFYLFQPAQLLSEAYQSADIFTGLWEFWGLARCVAWPHSCTQGECERWYPVPPCSRDIKDCLLSLCWIGVVLGGNVILCPQLFLSYFCWVSWYVGLGVWKRLALFALSAYSHMYIVHNTSCFRRVLSASHMVSWLYGTKVIGSGPNGFLLTPFFGSMLAS